MSRRASLLAIIALAGCGSSNSVEPSPSPTPTPSTTPSPSATPTPSASATASPVPTGVSGDNLKRIYQLRELQKVEAAIGAHKVRLYVCDSDTKRQEGMMWLVDKDVAADEGFLFIFPDAEQASFWMRNTLIPLDVCFFSPEKKLLNVQHGKPQDDSALPSEGAMQFVVELKSGIAGKLGLKKGDLLKFPEELKAVD